MGEVKRYVVREFEFKVEVIGKGRPILFLHGYGGSPKDWQDLIACMNPGIQAHVVSLKPLFSSQRPISFSEQIIYLKELLEQMFPNDKTLEIISTSYGSALAWGLTQTSDFQIRHVFINPMPLDPMRWMKSLELRMLAGFAKSRWLLSLFLSTARGREHLRNLGAIFGMGINSVPKRFDRRKRLLVFKALSRFLWLVQKEDWEKFTSNVQLKSEVLLIYSEDDPLYFPEDFKQYQGLFKETKFFRLSRAPHMMMQTHASLIASLIK